MDGMRPADILGLTEVGDPRLAPDGRQVAFVVVTIDAEDNRYRSRIWLAAVDGSVPAEPFSAGDDRDSRPRWSPDGRRLAFVSHREDNGSQIWTLPVAGGGEAGRVVAWPEEVEELAWSPDGSMLAFTARDRDEERYGKTRAADQPPRRVDRVTYRLNGAGWVIDRPRHLFVVPADGSAPPRLLTPGPFEVAGLAWSPAGDRIAFSSARHETWDLDLAIDGWTVTVGGEEPVLHRLTATGPTFLRPSWCPSDPSRIAFVRSDNRALPHHGHIVVVDADAREQDPPQLTASLDRNCANGIHAVREPAWQGSDVVFTVEDQGSQHLYRVGGDGGSAPVLVIGGRRDVADFDVTDGGSVTVFTASDPTHPTELFVAAEREERALTAFGARLEGRHRWVAPEAFTAVSADGTEVDGWVMLPTGGTGPAAAPSSVPAVLNIHGGPFSQYGYRFFDEFQLQVNAGYAVVFSNPRGSAGYSEAWGRAIRGPKAAVDPGTGWGSVDYDDVMAVTEEACRRHPVIDASRVAVMGGSYGGYLTSWIIGHTDRFRAAVSERAVNNLLTSCWTSDIGPFFDAQYLGVSFVDDPEECLRVSPISYVGEMRTPLLILHSEDDLRCPVEQAEQLFVALRMLGRTPEFVRFPGEHHELSRSGAPQHRVARAEIILDFLARHLG